MQPMNDTKLHTRVPMPVVQTGRILCFAVITSPWPSMLRAPWRGGGGVQDHNYGKNMELCAFHTHITQTNSKHETSGATTIRWGSHSRSETCQPACWELWAPCTGGRLQAVLMRPIPQLSFKTRGGGGGGGGSWGGGSSRGLGGGFLPGVRGGGGCACQGSGGGGG